MKGIQLADLKQFAPRLKACFLAQAMALLTVSAGRCGGELCLSA